MFLWDNREAFASLWSLLGSSFGGIRYGKSQTLPPSQHEAPIPVCYDPIWLGGWLLMPFPEQLNSWQLNSFMTKHLFVLCPQSPNLEASTGFKVPPKIILWFHDLKKTRNWGLWCQNLLDVGCPSLWISHRICGSFYLVLIFCNPHPLIQMFFIPASFPEVVELSWFSWYLSVTLRETLFVLISYYGMLRNFHSIFSRVYFVTLSLCYLVFSPFLR